MEKAKFCQRGICPYCSNTDFINEEDRNSYQKNMQCSSCSRWSVENSNNYQYPLMDPNDKASNPLTTSIY